MVVFAALAAGGALLSFTGKRQAAETANAIGDANYDYALRRARLIRAQGAEAASQHLLQIGHLIGTQRLGAATAGVSVETGAALELQAEAARVGSLDAAAIRYNSALQAWGVKAGAEIAHFGSQESAKAQKKAGYAGLLGAGGNFAALGTGG